jgi:hypothetical protein
MNELGRHAVHRLFVNQQFSHYLNIMAHFAQMPDIRITGACDTLPSLKHFFRRL